MEIYIQYIYNKNCGVSFWACSREISGDRVALFYYYDDNFSTVCINEMIWFWEKSVYYQQYTILYIILYILSEKVNQLCSLIVLCYIPILTRSLWLFSYRVMLHPCSGKVIVVILLSCYVTSLFWQGHCGYSLIVLCYIPILARSLWLFSRFIELMTNTCCGGITLVMPLRKCKVDDVSGHLCEHSF